MVSFYLASSMTVLSTALVYGQVNLQETSLSNLSEDRYWCKGRSTLRGQLRYASWRTVTGERADQLVMLLSGHILVLGQVNGQETSLCDLLEDRYLCKGRSTLKGRLKYSSCISRTRSNLLEDRYWWCKGRYRCKGMTPLFCFSEENILPCHFSEMRGKYENIRSKLK